MKTVYKVEDETHNGNAVCGFCLDLAFCQRLGSLRPEKIGTGDSTTLIGDNEVKCTRIRTGDPLWFVERDDGEGAFLGRDYVCSECADKAEEQVIYERREHTFLMTDERGNRILGNFLVRA